MNKSKSLILIGTLILSYITEGASLGKGEIPVLLEKNTSEIKVDGILNESIWEQIVPIKMTEYTPVNGAVPNEKTEIRITYDNQFIYIGAKMFVSDPEYIRINSFVRDIPTSGSEFNFFFTSDFQNLEGFSVNPAGKRVDAQILCNTDCDNWFNVDWNILWMAKTSITSEGWFVEAKIPISSLSFNEVDDHLDFGFIAHRLIAAKNERYTFPNISSEWPNGPFRASLAYKMSIENVKQPKPLYITPYVLSNYENYATKDEAYNGEFGIDLKYKISKNTTIDVTYNTDFSQVESDEQQINLTQFSLFYPEKRQFFQERSGVFTFNTGGSEKLFYSRRIGLSETGVPIPIIGGLRSVSKFGGWDVGIINMQTSKYNEQNAENFGVLRVKKNVLNPSSFIGAMLTSKLDAKGYYNYNAGMDTVLNIFQTDYLTLRAVNTIQKDNTVNANSSLIAFDWSRPSDVGIGYTQSFTHRGKDYNPAVGFVTRKNHFAMQNMISYGWLGKKDSKIRTYGPKLENYRIRNYALGRVEYNIFKAHWNIEMQSQNRFVAGYINEYTVVTDGFNISELVHISPNDYHAPYWQLQYEMSDRNLLRLSASVDTGKLYDGKGYILTLTPGWTVSKRIDMNGKIQINQFKFKGREEELNTTLLQLKTRISLNTKLSTNLLAQYNTDSEQLGLNARFRFNFKDGHDLYLVYNSVQQDAFKRAKDVETINLYEGLFVKYIYTFLK